MKNKLIVIPIYKWYIFKIGEVYMEKDCKDFEHWNVTTDKPLTLKLRNKLISALSYYRNIYGGIEYTEAQSVNDLYNEKHVAIKGLFSWQFIIPFIFIILSIVGMLIFK